MERGDSELVGLVVFAVIGLFLYGAWIGLRAVFHDGSALSQVNCHASGVEVYSGLTVGGVSEWWGSKTMKEYGTGQAIRVDGSAVCVERQLTKAEVAAQTAQSRRLDALIDATPAGTEPDHVGAAAWLRDPTNKADPRYARVLSAYRKANGGAEP